MSGNEVKNKLSTMTYDELMNMTEAALKFEKSTNIEIAQVLIVFKNLQNDEHGTSNKVQCASFSVNHWCVIAYLREKGWIDDNNDLTREGLLEMNDIKGVFDPELKPTLQNYYGSLYWNTLSPRFEKIWNDVIENCTDKKYNEKLTGTKLPHSPQTIALFKSLAEDGLITRKK